MLLKLLAYFKGISRYFWKVNGINSQRFKMALSVLKKNISFCL